ncbi:MAG: hypothetical protein FD138_417 [Planctomycetota bacterium]|nr:MAG: hypothetical protein FD138_417 [Planctomycetota bacterium]
MTEPQTVAAGALAPWEIDNLPEPPRSGRALWLGLIGPGIVLAGTSVGTGEWLFGPAVSAQYGASLFWLAMISIVLQGFANLMFMRYAIYCGEPVNVGILRTWPGPRAWITFFAVLDLTSIFPYNASNAAVPLAAAFLGRLPRPEDMLLVRGLGISIFLLAFVPLIFGGTIYRMLEKIMAAKLVVVLGYLSIIAVTMVSAPVVWDVATGFFRFGTVPLRPDVLIVGRHFSVREVVGETEYLAKGTWESRERLLVTGDFIVRRGEKTTKFNLNDPSKLDRQAADVMGQMMKDTNSLAGTNQFYFEFTQSQERWKVWGDVFDHHEFNPTRLEQISLNPNSDWRSKGYSPPEGQYVALEEVPEPQRSRLRNHLQHEGLAYVSVFGYVGEHGRLPPLDWAMVVGFIAIAGAGGLTNTMFSNYARDKGWGMGCHVGAIPSACGGLTIALSHTGKVFPLDDANRSKWSGWMQHIRRDQAIWMFASVIGMALPCMMSLEFIRNASVVGDRVSAMSAEGIAARYPASASLFWFLTLICGFLVLAPGQVSVGDQIARRWTDMIWNASARVRQLGEVRYIYYGILAAYAVGGLVILTILPPVDTAKISAVLQNIALGSVSLMSIYVNRTLLPKEVQPGWFHQLGVLLCGVFFLSISIALLFI